MVNVTVNDVIVLYHTKDGSILTLDERNMVLTDIFIELSANHPSLVPVHTYVEANRDCAIGIGGISDKTHLMPTFNNTGVPSLQCEFTHRINAKQIGFMELSKAHEKMLQKFDAEIGNELRSVVNFATLEIGSIGSRSTNRDISFELYIDYLPTEKILAIISPYVKVVNKDKRNKNRSFGYVLTCRTEVEAFIEAANLDIDYLKAVEAVEDYQERNKLAEQYDGERVSDYKAKTYLKKVKLAA